jgi:hypothetical protein
MINSGTREIGKSTTTIPVMGCEPGKFGRLFGEKNSVDRQKMEERNRY